MLKKSFKVLLILLMVFSTLGIATTTTLKVEATDVEYEIYPLPQKVEYGAKAVDLSGEVNVVIESEVDEATKNRLKEILDNKGINYQIGTAVNSDKTNVLVGTYQSGGVVDTYFADNSIGGATAHDHFTKFDSHILSVKDNVVAVLGKDSDAAFYGLTTLKLIADQIEGTEIRELQIEDFSDGQWRGFIEGYYGIPWSHENRKSLMEFGGDFKMNSYIFAPKDDVYHSQKWRDLYPAEELAKIQELAETGEATKCNFIWTIHPFLKDGMDFSSEAKYQEELAKITAKFDQLYNVGVRQFGVLADDAEGDENNQVKLMNDLEAWRLAKTDVKSFIFVPKVYTKESAGGDVNNAYLNTIGTLPSTIDVLWTGDVIMGYVTQDTFDFFKQAVGREPLMWLNWPVNDINSSRLLMGKGEMLDANVTGFKGIVTNPMQEAQASKVSLFAIADYGWNTADFNTEKSWEDSFKYIDQEAGDELYTFAKHMSDPTPNWHGLALDESKEIRPLLESFRNKFFNGESIAQDSKTLLTEYKEIINATNNFFAKSKNELLKTEIKPWVDALRDISESTTLYIQAAQALEAGKTEDAMRFYTQAEAEYANSRTHRAPTLDGPTGKRAEPAIKELIPFAKDLSRLIGEKINQEINPDKEHLVLLPYTNMGPNLYWGHIQNIVDGGNARLSCMWVRNSAKAGDFVAVKLNKTTKVNSIIFEHGEPGAGDSFNYVKFQSSMDGENWTDIDGKAYGPKVQKIVIEDLDVKANYVRAIPTGEILNNWISVREFSINKDDPERIVRDIYTNVDSLKQEKVEILPASSNLTNMNNITLKENQYIGIKLDKIKDVTAISSDITNNDKLAVETSINGVEWTSTKAKANNVAARYIRVINNSDKSVTFDINKLGVEYTSKDVTFDVRPAAESGFLPTNLIDGKLSTAFKAQVNAPKTGSLVYKLSENTDVTKLTIVQDPTTISSAVVSVRSEDGWKEVGTLESVINTLDTSYLSNVFEVKIAWDGTAPTLYEIGTSNAKNPTDVDKTQLQALVTQAEALKADEYTTDSWAVLQDKLAEAKVVLANVDATQDEVDATKSALLSALEGLVEKSDPNPNDGNTPDDGNDGNQPQPQDSSNTGDYTTVAPFAMLALLSLVIIIVGKRKFCK